MRLLHDVIPLHQPATEAESVTIVIRILDELGWGRAAGERKQEFKANQKVGDSSQADIFLFCGCCPAVVIEVKSMSELNAGPTEAIINQAFNYCYVHESTRFVVVTDGLRWYIYDRLSDAPRPDRLVCQVNLFQESCRNEDWHWLCDSFLRRDRIEEYLPKMRQIERRLPEETRAHPSIQNLPLPDHVWELMKRKLPPGFYFKSSADAWSSWEFSVNGRPRFFRVAIDKKGLAEVRFTATKNTGIYPELKDYLERTWPTISPRVHSAIAALYNIVGVPVLVIGKAELVGRPSSESFQFDAKGMSAEMAARNVLEVMGALRREIDSPHQAEK